MSTTIYCTVDEVKDSLEASNSASDGRILRAVTTASRMVDGYTGRRFYRDTDAGGLDVVSARVYWPDKSLNGVCVDDFATSTGLLVKSDAGDDGTYELAYTNYQLYPLNALADGIPWAYESIRLNNGLLFPADTYKPPVQVTACWGWPSVPDAVKQATIVQTIRLFSGEKSPFGVLEVADLAVARMPSVHPEVAALLAPYRKWPVLVG